jgi:uncharacterized protein (TIGR00251 family)
MLVVREGGGAVSFDVLVTPRASRERVGPVVEGRLKVAVTALPVEGEANAAVCTLVARSLGVARSRVSVVHGETGRRKTIRVEGIDAAAVRAFAGD